MRWRSLERAEDQTFLLPCNFFFKQKKVLTLRTANMAWPEIQSLLRPGESPEDRRDLVCRVFNQKYQEMLKWITKYKIFGPVASWMYTIEFQVKTT